ncbi:MAG: tripartite tricarboxylate transporter substrate binding protein [Chloroflexota bacterium]
MNGRNMEEKVKRFLVSVAAAAAVASLALVGCSQAAPTPASPTKAAQSSQAAAPTSAPAAAQPTSAPAAAQPTAAPAKKVDFPQKGKPITLLVPWAAGGGNDVGARVLAPALEKELGTPVEVVNKTGAGSQVGITELVKSKPDGYVVGATALPATNTLYLDKERKAVFGRKDFQPLAMHVVDPGVIAVKADSPYKSVKELVEAAKANPEKVKVSSTGVMGSAHLAILQVEKVTGAKFAIVHFDGFSPSLTALLGGHIDAQFGYAGEFLSQVKTGQVRLLGVMDKEPSKFFPEVKTLESQGYQVYMASSRGWSVPVGTPKEVVDVLSGAIKKAMTAEEHKKKMDEMGLALRYMDPAELGKYWDEVDAQITPLMELAKQK